IVPPSEFGGGAPTKSSSLRRLSLQPGSKAAASSNLGVGSPPTGPGASGRVSCSSSTPTLDKKLATLPEEAPKPPPPAKAKGRLSKSPKPSVLHQPSALPKYKPKVSSLVSTAPSKVPPSPVRLGTRKRRQSEDSSSATLSSGSATANDAAKESLSPPAKPPAARPVSGRAPRVSGSGLGRARETLLLRCAVLRFHDNAVAERSTGERLLVIPRGSRDLTVLAVHVDAEVFRHLSTDVDGAELY
ncbi:hypothetical protein AURDEDRAFT_177611, partial [Auricularia subglabra TFB-10046 SS5]